MEELIQRHEVLLLDAYGVLVHHQGPLPGAPALIAHLNKTNKPYYILTNDAARLPETTSRRLAAMGLSVAPRRIISSGTLLVCYFKERGLAGRRCAVLGPADSMALVELAGGRPVPPGEEADVFVLCDEAGFDFVPSVDGILSMLFARFDQDRPVELVLPNPDLVYPRGEGAFGITAGSMALIFEAALAQRYPERTDTRFVRLGKPARPIFAQAVARAGSLDAVMVGDQLGTDIKGARDFGLASALVGTGLTPLDSARLGELPPTYLLERLWGPA